MVLPRTYRLGGRNLIAPRCTPYFATSRKSTGCVTWFKRSSVLLAALARNCCPLGDALNESPGRRPGVSSTKDSKALEGYVGT
jgi:hypothetical protein